MHTGWNSTTPCPLTPDERLRIVRKAVAYITWNGHVLFFRAREPPTLGAELPGGTLAEGEDPVAGVLREADEETGAECDDRPTHSVDATHRATSHRAPPGRSDRPRPRQ